MQLLNRREYEAQKKPCASLYPEFRSLSLLPMEGKSKCWVYLIFDMQIDNNARVQ